LGKIILVVGPGNNGADAIACARHLLTQNLELLIFLPPKSSKHSKYLDSELVLLQDAIKKQHDSRVLFFENFAELLRLEHDAHLFNIIIVDALFGAGLSRAPAGIYKEAIENINTLRTKLKENALVISIDVPSGCTLEACTPLGACVFADHTITFGFLKRCHVSEPTKKYVGQSHVKEIGFSAEAHPQQYLIKKSLLSELLKPIEPGSHKGKFGHMAVLEGHPSYKGASRLCARAALRAGVGLCTIITNNEESIHPADLAEYMKHWREAVNEEFLNKLSALAIGPGLSKDRSFKEHALSLLRRLPKALPLVIDADALILIKEDPKGFQSAPIVCTPHPKEAANLLDISVEELENNRFLAIKALAKLPINRARTVVWVLKGATTLVHQNNEPIFAFAGDLPILATGGSGDVLTGTIAGLIPQTNSLLEASLLAVSLQKTAARKASEFSNKGLLPSELADLYPSLLVRSIL
jgi:hydroxyethylthiazole kinase-like uncharacterized protein yjeF